MFAMFIEIFNKTLTFVKGIVHTLANAFLCYIWHLKID